ncbi:MAG: DedA family protein [bacterium]|nr:DedA family protein [bacterium]
MEHFFDIPAIIAAYGYAGILIIVFLESGIFFPLPGDSLLFTVGLLATKLEYNVFLFTFLVALSAFLGCLAGYYIGTKLDYFYKFSLWRRVIKKHYLDEAGEFLSRHGLFAIVLSRFVPVIRTFLPIVAGMARMKYYDFLRYSALACVVWSAAFVLGGYYLGKIFPQIGEYLSVVILLIVFVSILPGVWHFVKRKKSPPVSLE